MAKFFRFPWATAGDKTAIPDATDVTGLVSYQQGYGADYQRDPATDPLAKRIERNKLNQVLADITDNVRLHQTNTFPAFITSADNGGVAFAYDVDAIVRYDDGGGYNLYQNTTAANTNIPTGAGWVLKEGIAGLNSPSLTGTPTIGGVNLSPYYGRNYLINSNFDRWDYATSQTTGGYGSDNRWSNYNVGSTKTHSRITSTDTERALFNSPYFSRTAVTSVAAAGNYVVKTQAIENVTKLAGKTVTLSFWAKADTAKNIHIWFTQNFGTGGTPSGIIDTGRNTVALTSTWQKKSITITLPSIIGKTLGTDGVHTSSTLVKFLFDEFNALGSQSGTFDIAEVQLEKGSVATTWSPYFGEFGGEIQACERYYETGPFGLFSGDITSGGTYSGIIRYRSLKRDIPATITLLDTSNAGFPAGAPTVINNSTSSFSGIKTANATSSSGSFTFSFASSAEL